MTDILKSVSVDVRCEQCGEFTVGADVIAESQRLLAGGCPGSSFECPPTLFATLLPRSALESFERAWVELESAARSPVRHLAVGEESSVTVAAGFEPERRAISRWEDDGGYVPTPRLSARRGGDS